MELGGNILNEMKKIVWCYFTYIFLVCDFALDVGSKCTYLLKFVFNISIDKRKIQYVYKKYFVVHML